MKISVEHRGGMFQNLVSKEGKLMFTLDIVSPLPLQSKLSEKNIFVQSQVRTVDEIRYHSLYVTWSFEIISTWCFSTHSNKSITKASRSDET